MRVRGCGVREIARRTGRSPSTISRELRRNAATRGGRLEYRAMAAQWHADLRGRRRRSRKSLRTRPCGSMCKTGSPARSPGRVAWRAGSGCALDRTPHGRRADRRWARSWSPEQIANRLRADFPDDECMRVSHEATPGPVCPGPRRAAARADGVPAHRPGAARPPGTHPRPRQEVRDARDPDQPAARGGGGPGGARALGGRPDHGAGQLGDRHPGRAHDPVHDAAAPAPDGGPRQRSPGQEGPALAATAPRRSGTRSPPPSLPCLRSCAGR